jgi:coenzyme F420-reducing hydrogenase alpha subunit
VGYLVAPDLLGQKSVVPVVGTHPELVKTVIRAHRLGNEIMTWLGGRRTHPVTIRPGGFTRLPTESELRDFQGRLQKVIPDLKAIAGAVAGLADKIPAFDRPTEYIALHLPQLYSFYHGDIASTDTPERVSIQEFERVANEYVSPQSTAKWTRWHRDAYAVGALARFNLNAPQLLPLAKETAKSFGLVQGCGNPFMNNIAQIVESVQVVEHALQLLDELLTSGIKPEFPRHAPKAGQGAGSVEAPRGILFHRYAFNAQGRCLSANICIPTNQNHANIQKDFEALVPKFLDRGQETLRQIMEMLVRSYDPCISCSTHYLDVKFV